MAAVARAAATGLAAPILEIIVTLLATAAGSTAEKLALARRLATFRLACGVVPELDACFTALRLGGQVDLMIVDLTTSLPQVKAGKLRALALAAPRRSPLVPEVPTMAEVGYPDSQVLAWFAILLPAKTPRDIVYRVNREVARALADPDVHAIALTTEEEGVAMLAGADLGGARGVLLMQSSGAGNCINSVLSLMKIPR